MEDVDNGKLPEIRSNNNMETVSYMPIRENTTIGLQTDHGVELPRLTDGEPEMRPATAQVMPVSYSYDYGAGVGVPYNNYYQRQQVYRDMSMDPSASYQPQYYVPPPNPNKLYVEPGPPVFRAGRLGAPWRHIRQCTGNLGNHICFVDGVVKQEDMKKYPPFGYTAPERHHLQPRAVPMRKPAPLPDNGKVRGRFQKHAKEGFRYWHEEKRPVQPARPVMTISGRMMKLGVGH